MRDLVLWGLAILLLPLRLMPWLVHDAPPRPSEWIETYVTWQTNRSWIKKTYRLMERPTCLGWLLFSGALVAIGILIGKLL